MSHELYNIGTTIPDIWVNNNSAINTGTFGDKPDENIPRETVEFNNIGDKISTLLSTSYKKIKNKYIYFNVYITGNNVKPIEDILLLIKRKELFNVTIFRCGYNIYLGNVNFINIKNLIETTATKYIKVEFDYNTMEYENTLKSKTEKRKEKLNLLKHNIKNDI